MPVQYLQFQSTAKRPLVIEVEDNRAGAAAGGLVTRTQDAIGEMIAGLADLIQPIQQSLEACAKDASEIKLELGVKVGADLGVIIAKTQAEGNFKISLSWKKE